MVELFKCKYLKGESADKVLIVENILFKTLSATYAKDLLDIIIPSLLIKRIPKYFIEKLSRLFVN